MHNRKGDIYSISLSLPSFSIVFGYLLNEEMTYFPLGPGPWRYFVGGSDQFAHLCYSCSEKLLPGFNGIPFPVTRSCYLVSVIFLY